MLPSSNTAPHCTSALRHLSISPRSRAVPVSTRSQPCAPTRTSPALRSPMPRTWCTSIRPRPRLPRPLPFLARQQQAQRRTAPGRLALRRDKRPSRTLTAPRRRQSGAYLACPVWARWKGRRTASPPRSAKLLGLPRLPVHARRGSTGGGGGRWRWRPG